MLIDYNEVCERLDDLPVYAARVLIEDNLVRIISDQVHSLTRQTAGQ